MLGQVGARFIWAEWGPVPPVWGSCASRPATAQPGAHFASRLLLICAGHASAAPYPSSAASHASSAAPNPPPPPSLPSHSTCSSPSSTRHMRRQQRAITTTTATTAAWLGSKPPLPPTSLPSRWWQRRTLTAAAPLRAKPPQAPSSLPARCRRSQACPKAPPPPLPLPARRKAPPRHRHLGPHRPRHGGSASRRASCLTRPSSRRRGCRCASCLKAALPHTPQWWVKIEHAAVVGSNTC